MTDKVVVINETLTISEKINISKTRQVLEKNIKFISLLISLFIITPVVSYSTDPVIGLILGVILGGLSFVFSPYALNWNTHTDHYSN